LSLHTGDLSLEMCAAVAQESEPDALFSDLDELVREEVLVGADDVYRFRHDGLREALARSVEPKRRRDLHLRIAYALGGPSVADDNVKEAVGFHLYYGGQLDEGAQLLHEAAEAHFAAAAFQDAIAPLQAAVDVYRTRGATPERLAEAKHLLIAAGFYCDRDLVAREVDEALSLFARYGGVSRIASLQRFAGKRIGISLGLLWTALVHRLTPKRARGPRPIIALRMYARAVIYAAVSAMTEVDSDRLAALVRRIEPFNAFRRGNGYGIYLLVCILRDYALGRVEAVRRTASDLI